MPRVRSLLRLGLLTLGLAACRGPAKPRPIDTKRLAQTLHADLVELSAIASRQRGHCPELIAELRPHVAKMRAHTAEATRALEDAAVARQLKIEMTAYDEQARGLADTIGNDLAASFMTCKDNPGLQQVIDAIPEL